MSTDPRVLRLNETLNTRSGEYVRVLDVSLDSQGKPEQYNFEDLCGHILPSERPETKKQLKVKEERKSSTEGLLRLNKHRLNYDRWMDLQRLAKIRGWDKNGVPKGYRSKYVHWLCNFGCLLGTTFWGDLYDQADVLIEKMCPSLTKTKRVTSIFSTLLSKAKAYARGEKVEYQGKLYAPLYTPRNSTLIKLFDITQEEQKQLKTIIGTEEKKARKKVRNAKRHRLSREDYEAKRQEAAEFKEHQVKELTKQGLKQVEIVAMTGFSKGRVSQLVKKFNGASL